MQGIMRALLWQWLVAAIVVATACATSLQTDPQRDGEGTPPPETANPPQELAFGADEAVTALTDSVLTDSALTDSTHAALIDTAQILAPWLPSPVDTVMTAVVASASTLTTVLTAHAVLEDAGAPVFARIRTDGSSYWYELVVGPFPAAAALDSALADLEGNQVLQNDSDDQDKLNMKASELVRPVADLWERQSRGIVAPPQHVAGRTPPPAQSSMDSSQGG